MLPVNEFTQRTEAENVLGPPEKGEGFFFPAVNWESVQSIAQVRT